jgi:hypothetical protein
LSSLIKELKVSDMKKMKKGTIATRPMEIVKTSLFREMRMSMGEQ